MRLCVTKHFIMALLVFAWAQLVLHAQDCVGIGVSMAKPQYLQGELLEVLITFENHRSLEQGIVLRYPLAGIAFTPMAALKPSGNLFPDTGGVFPITPIPAGQKVIARLYLDRFLDGFNSGHYEIPWTLTIPCSDAHRINFTGSASANGLLRFDISNASIAASSSLFETYFQRLQQGAPDEPFFRAAAAEALILSSSPLVVPYLQRMVTGISYREHGCEGLMKFDRDPGAHQFILDSLKSEDLMYCGLKVLSVWGERLPSDEIQQLLDRNRNSRLATLAYMGRVQDSAYLSLVEPYLSDPDEEVAKAATQAKIGITR